MEPEHHCSFILCRKPANKFCVHVDINGSEVGIPYCSKLCLRADWPDHKKSCKESDHRRQLYHAGSLLKNVFHTLLRIGWDQNFAKIEKQPGGEIHIWESYDPRDGFLRRFSSPDTFDAKDAEALLTYNQCELPAATSMVMITRDLLEGCVQDISEWRVLVNANGERVSRHNFADVDHSTRRVVNYEPEPIKNHRHIVTHITLRDNNEYILDLAGAQMNNHNAIMPAAQYKEKFVEEVREQHPFGTLRKVHSPYISGAYFKEPGVRDWTLVTLHKMIYAIVKWLQLRGGDLITGVMQRNQQDFLHFEQMEITKVQNFLEQWITTNGGYDKLLKTMVEDIGEQYEDVLAFLAEDGDQYSKLAERAKKRRIEGSN